MSPETQLAIIREAARILPHVEVLGGTSPAAAKLMDCDALLPGVDGCVYLLPVLVYSPDDLCTLTSTLIVHLRASSTRIAYYDARLEDVKLSAIDAVTAQ